MTRAEQLFEQMAARLLGRPNVSQGTGFGSNPGLRVGGKVFAMLNRGALVVKLPKERVDQLVASGAGSRFDPRRDGRLMKEWVTVPAGRGREWGTLADEALTFVASAAAKARRR